MSNGSSASILELDRCRSSYWNRLRGTTLTYKCIEILTEEHKLILGIADVLESIANRTEFHLVFEERDVTEVLQILTTFGDDFHQAKEEGALFPVLTASCHPSQQAAIRHMLLEHEQ